MATTMTTTAAMPMSPTATPSWSLRVTAGAGLRKKVEQPAPGPKISPQASGGIVLPFLPVVKSAARKALERPKIVCEKRSHQTL